MWQAIKNVVLWNYGRTTWQYDVLCILILAFIFLTPPAWFQSGKERSVANSPKITRLVVSPDHFSPEFDEPTRLQRVRELSGNKDAEIIAWREKIENGKLTAYEIDVR